MSVSGDGVLLPVEPSADEPRTWALDGSIAQLDVPPAVWWRAAWQTVVGTIAILVITEGGVALWGHVAGHPLNHVVAELLGVAVEVAILAVTLYAARTVRAGTGSWYAALGWARPRPRDLGWGLLWAILQLIGAGVIHLAFTLLASSETVHAASNTRHLQYHGPVPLVLALITAVVIAPIAEETQCRGLLLRAGMSRWSFTRAALLSSLFFGALHANQAESAAGALLLVTAVATFGVLQCLLVRITGRLAPGAITHGLINGLAIWAALTS